MANTFIIDGNWIKKLREDSGLSQQYFSSIFAVTPQTLMNWESGKSIPSQYHLAGLLQLRKKIDEEKNNLKSDDDISNNIKTILIAGGIVALLIWLFNQD